MRVLSLSPDPVAEVVFLNAGKTPGGFYEDRLPIQTARVDRLPDGLDAIVATADLQGRERTKESPTGLPRLLGEVLPERLIQDVLPRAGIPGGRIGAILAGDFYTVAALDRRGGSGDVTDVWHAFGREFDWVVGVAGNHDTFGEDPHAAPRFSGNLHYLEARRVKLDGIIFAGLGGIIGNPRRPRRRSDEDYARCLANVLENRVDVLISHDGPNDPVHRGRGSSIVRELLERQGPSLVIRGHAHWEQPLAELAGGTQVLNVDARVVVLHR